MQNFFDQFDNADPIVKSNAPAPVRPEVAEGNVLTNQQKRNDIATAPYDARKAAADASKAEADATTAQLKADAAVGKKPEAARQSAIDSLTTVIKKIDDISVDAADNSGWGETGATGSLSRKLLPAGTAGYDLAENLKTIDANSAFTSLQAMRDASPTGGALGQITERELDLLKAKVANLNPDQSQEQFQANLAEAREFYMSMLEKAGGEYQPEGLTGKVTAYPEIGTPGEKVEENGVMVGFYGADGQFNPIDTGSNFDADGNPISADELNEKGDSQYIKAFGGGMGDIVEGIGDTLGIVANPLNTAINSATGAELSTDLGQTFRDASGLPDSQNETAAAINKGGISALGFAGLARPAAKFATGATQNALSKFAASPGVDTVGGAAAGGAATLAPADSPGLQVAAALAGGIGASGLTQSAKNLASRTASQPNALAQAAQRQGVDLLPADTGGPTAKRITAAAAQAPISANPVIKASQRTRDHIGKAANRAATREGTVMSDVDAGEAVRSAGKLYVKNETARISRIYDAAEKGAKGVTIKPKTALAQIDDSLARLSEMSETNAPLISTMKKLQTDLSDGISVSGLRDARTALAQGVYDGKLRSNQEKKMLGDIVETISQDIDAGLRQAGRDGVASRFRRADAEWKERISQIDEVLEPVIGKAKSGEDILKAVQKMGEGQRGGVARLSRLMKELPKEQVGNIRATVVNRLGKATAGQQDDIGGSFSANTFLTNWNKLSKEGKSALFGNDGLRRDLDEIAKIASATKEAGKYANHSNSSGGIWGNLGVLAGTAALDVKTAGAATATQLLTGRLMSSPAFARWLAKAPKNPKAAQKYTDRLSVLAAREPAIAGDAKALQQHLHDSFAQSPGKLAAAEKEDN